MRSVPSNVIAACVGLAAFTVALLAGLAAGNTTASILARALIAMFVCYPVGLIIGLVCDRVAAGHLAAYRKANPVPTDPDDAEPPPASVPPEDEEVIVV